MRFMFIAMLLTACGTAPTSIDVKEPTHGYRPTVVHAELAPLVDKFKDLYKIQFNIRVEFFDLDSPSAGMCYSWSNGHREIDIDQEEFEYMDEYEQEILVFHELGHCILNRGHDDTDYAGDWIGPNSIMNPYIFSGETYFEHRKYYRDELILNRDKK